MHTWTIERQFDRFRRKGDVRALARVFDATAPELYAVAVHLTPDLHAAEDLVQSTFLAAIEARESFDVQRKLMAWLFGILTRKAAWEHRNRSRTIDAERLPPRGASDPSEEVEREELSASVARALEQLPSPYREVLQAHLLEGQAPREIALSLRRAPGTVRVQLHRGLELLRQALPAGLATGGVIAGLSPRGLSVVRATTLSAAQHVVVSISAGAAAAPTAVIGGILVKVKALVVAGAVLALVGAGAFLVGGLAPDRPIAAEGGSPRPSPVEALVLPEKGPELAAAEPLTHERALAPEAASGSARTGAPTLAAPMHETAISGRYLQPGGVPAAGAFVALLRSVDAAPGDVVVQARSRNDGVFRLIADPGAYWLVGVADGFLPVVQDVELTLGEEKAVEPATFSAGAHVRGRVRILGEPAPEGCRIGALSRAEGQAVELAGARFVWAQGRLRPRSRESRTDAQGSFAIEALDAGLHQVSVESAPDERILRAALEVEAPAEGIQLDVEAARLIVHLQSAGLPVEGSVVLKEKQRGGGSTWGLGTGATVQALIVPGTSYEVVGQKQGFTSASLELLAPRSGETIERVLELKAEASGAELVIDLVAPDGKLIEAAGFALFGTVPAVRPPDPFLRMGPGGRHPDLVRNESGTDGRFFLRELPPGKFELLIRPEGTWQQGSGLWFHDPIEVELFAGGIQTLRVDLRLGGRLRVQCSDRRGTALPAGCRLFDAYGAEVPIVFFAQENGSTWQGQGVLNAGAPRGANEIHPNLAPGTYEIRLAQEGFRDASRSVRVEAGKIVDVNVVLEDR